MGDENYASGGGKLQEMPLGWFDFQKSFASAKWLVFYAQISVILFRYPKDGNCSLLMSRSDCFLILSTTIPPSFNSTSSSATSATFTIPLDSSLFTAKYIHNLIVVTVMRFKSC